MSVLIESDWNLKEDPICAESPEDPVLIESDWNLKPYGYEKVNDEIGINRIRLEFKGRRLTASFSLLFSINRIRLEFKDGFKVYFISDCLQCINRIRLEFKDKRAIFSRDSQSGINRIRLEFKVVLLILSSKVKSVLIESDWNLK